MLGMVIGAIFVGIIVGPVAGMVMLGRQIAGAVRRLVPP